MSIPRLPFLYPHLFAPVRIQKSVLTLKPLHATQNPLQKAGISTARPLRQEAFPQRYGTAAEPQPLPSLPPKPQQDTSLAGAIEKEVKGDTKAEPKSIEAPPSKKPEKKVALDSKDKDQSDRFRDAAITTAMRDPSARATELDASESHPKQPSPQPISNNQALTANPLETVLQTGAPPAAEKSEEHKTLHMHAPLYVHHFDTFTLVKDLERGGFSEEQSVTLMKAVRGLLAVNLEVAKEGLVSKSDVENVNTLPRNLFPPLFPLTINLLQNPPS